MNLALRQVRSQTFRLCDRLTYRNLPKQIPITSSSCHVIQFRNYCEEKVEMKKLPQLMEFPPVVWPSFIKFIKNWMFANFIIRPYFEHEFNLNEFIEASKHAVQVFITFYLSYLLLSNSVLLYLMIFKYSRTCYLLLSMFYVT